jgi:hypothetical protein
LSRRSRPAANTVAKAANAMATLKRRGREVILIDDGEIVPLDGKIVVPSRRRLRSFTHYGDRRHDILSRLSSHLRDAYRETDHSRADWLRAERAVQAQQRRKAERALRDTERAAQEELRVTQKDLLIWRVATGEQRSRLSRAEQLRSGLECLKWESLNSGRQAEPDRWPGEPVKGLVDFRDAGQLVGDDGNLVRARTWSSRLAKQLRWEAYWAGDRGAWAVFFGVLERHRGRHRVHGLRDNESEAPATVSGQRPGQSPDISAKRIHDRADALAARCMRQRQLCEAHLGLHAVMDAAA